MRKSIIFIALILAAGMAHATACGKQGCPDYNQTPSVGVGVAVGVGVGVNATNTNTNTVSPVNTSTNTVSPNITVNPAINPTINPTISTRLKQLAAQVEEAALTIEQEQEGNAQSLEKLKQPQSILKSL